MGWNISFTIMRILALPILFSGVAHTSDGYKKGPDEAQGRTIVERESVAKGGVWHLPSLLVLSIRRRYFGPGSFYTRVERHSRDNVVEGLPKFNCFGSVPDAVMQSVDTENKQ